MTVLKKNKRKVGVYMIDGYGRKINYLRLSVTDLCNLRCVYCMPKEGVPKANHDDILSFEEMEELVRVLAKMGIEKVRLTGGEPLVRHGIIDLVKRLKKINGIKELTMTTNGLLLSTMARQLKEAGLDRVNISMDSMKPDVYHTLTRGGKVEEALEGILAAIKVGFDPIKLNTVLIKGYNDDEIEAFVQLTKKYTIDVRFIELMPIGEVANWNESRYIRFNEVLEKVPELIAVKGDDPSSPAVYYRLPEGKGKIGLIRPISCKFCSNCNRIRITSDGKLKYCLHSDHELDLRKLLHAGKDLSKEIQTYLLQKPLEHQLEEGKYIKKSMSRIGG